MVKVYYDSDMCLRHIGIAEVNTELGGSVEVELWDCEGDLSKILQRLNAAIKGEDEDDET